MIAMAAGIALGTVVGLTLKERIRPGGGPGTHPGVPASTQMPEGFENAAELADNEAVQYALAFQQGDWDAVIDKTLWMQERLSRVQREGGAEAAERERLVLGEQLSQRTVMGNQMRPEGIEDQYVFVPGARFEFLSMDEGRDDLEAETAGRTWIRVIFPERTRAPRDASSIPIRSLVVGVNVSTDGHVLKGNVIGNLEIDAASISYAWKRPQRGKV